METIVKQMSEYGRKLLEAYGIDPNKRIAETLVKTELGLLSKENANWLYLKGVINRKGNILNTRTKGISTETVSLYSYLQWTLQDIKESIPTTPDAMYLHTDDYLQLARTGKLEKKYIVDGVDYLYMATYPIVDSIEREGKDSFVKHQPTTGKGKRIDLSVFNN